MARAIRASVRPGSDKPLPGEHAWNLERSKTRFCQTDGVEYCAHKPEKTLAKRGEAGEEGREYYDGTYEFLG